MPTTADIQALGAGKLIFGDTGSAKEFASLVTKVQINPNFEDGESIPVLSGDSVVNAGKDSYDLEGEFFQDTGAGMESLIVWCKKNSGQEMPFEFVANDKGLSVKGKVVIRAVKFGGEVKKKNTTDFKFKGVGDYTYQMATA